jgi:hypothetical protein
MGRRERDRERGRAGKGGTRRWWVAGTLAVALSLVLGFFLADWVRGRADGRGAFSAPARVGAVEVPATRIDLGRVKLDRWVYPTFRLRNVSDERVAFTIPPPGVQTLEGC